MVDESELLRICEEGLAAIGYDLVELEYLRDQQGWVLRLYIDLAELGAERDDEPCRITHGDCERASRHIGTILDVEDPIEAAYRLEVSSPGVRRPVRKQRDFERFVGRTMLVQMRDAIDGRRKFIGRLVAVAEGMITIEVDGCSFSLPLAGMRKARLGEEPAVPTSGQQR